VLCSIGRLLHHGGCGLWWPIALRAPCACHPKATVTVTARARRVEGSWELCEYARIHVRAVVQSIVQSQIRRDEMRRAGQAPPQKKCCAGALNKQRNADPE
jgi:hypothetical protein